MRVFIQFFSHAQTTLKVLRNISSINSNVSRAWKKHKKYQYFVVPIGEVKFVFLDNNFKEIVLKRIIRL